VEVGEYHCETIWRAGNPIFAEAIAIASRASRGAPIVGRVAQTPAIAQLKDACDGNSDAQATPLMSLQQGDTICVVVGLSKF
jgi:hypothetical protein